MKANAYGWRRYSWAVVFVLTLMALLHAPGGAVASEQAPVLSATEIDYPPFSIVDEAGRATGFSVELLRAALAAMDRDVVFRTGPWAEVRGWLETGQVQVLPLVGRTPEREEIFDFTVPYMSLHVGIVVREGTDDIRNMNDLRGRNVAVMKADNAEEFLRREDRGILIHTTDTFEQALHELSQGRHDAVVMQRLVALRLIQKTGLKNLRVIDRPIEGFRQDFCFAVQKGDSSLLSMLNEGLALVVADGTYRRLHSRWFAALELPVGRIVVGGHHKYPPFEYLDEKGRPAGFNVELTRAIARELGLEVEIRLGSWAEMVQELEHGEINVLTMFYSKQRSQIFDFTQPIKLIHNVGLVRRGEGDPPVTIDDLKGKRIVVQQSDALVEFLEEHGLAAQVSQVETQEDVLRELAEGRHDCALASRISSLHIIRAHGWTNLELAREPFIAVDYSYAVPKGHAALLDQFGKGLHVLTESGELRRMQEEWLGMYEEHVPTFAEILRHVAMILVPVIILLLGVLIWFWLLRRQVRLKTRQLQESEARFRTLFSESPVSIIIHDRDTGEIVDANKTAYTGYGFTSIEELQANDFWLDPPYSFAEALEWMRKAVTEGPQFFEWMNRKTSGEIFWEQVSLVPMAIDKIERVLATSLDITDRKRADEEQEILRAQLLQAQKMESVGRLAGGVAHDFNNMLQSILINAELALGKTDPADPRHAYLQEVVNVTMHSADLTRHLLAFARKQTVAPVVIDLNDTVESMLKMLRRLIGEDIDLVWRPGHGLWSVKVDPTQVDQILANLCVNARDAIAGTGKITIETENVTLDQAYCARHAGFIPGEFVLLAVSDNGRGMDKEVQEHIFEPFFTTKEVGKGTGLGLSTVYGIVKQNDGFINVYSEPGQGTTFRINLPRHGGQIEVLEPQESGCAPRGRGETVMVVEDDVSILKLSREVLEGLGFAVLPAPTPRDALDLAKAHAGRIDLLVTDVVMPEMNGRDLAERLHAMLPDLKVLFMSGYTADVIAHHGVLNKGVHFIQKPFTMYALGLKVRAVLDQGRAPGADHVPGRSPSLTITPQSSLAALPRDTLQAMREAVEDGDMSVLRDLISQVAAVDQSVAEVLKALADQYDYEGLLGMMNDE